MSERLHTFEMSTGRTAVFLPFPLRDLIAGWSGLRAPMIRERPPAFTRDEWAYLLEFLDPRNLQGRSRPRSARKWTARAVP